MRLFSFWHCSLEFFCHNTACPGMDEKVPPGLAAEQKVLKLNVFFWGFGWSWSTVFPQKKMLPTSVLIGNLFTFCSTGAGLHVALQASNAKLSNYKTKAFNQILYCCCVGTSSVSLWRDWEREEMQASNSCFFPPPSVDLYADDKKYCLVATDNTEASSSPSCILQFMTCCLTWIAFTSSLGASPDLQMNRRTVQETVFTNCISTVLLIDSTSSLRLPVGRPEDLLPSTHHSSEETNLLMR